MGLINLTSVRPLTKAAGFNLLSLKVTRIWGNPHLSLP